MPHILRLINYQSIRNRPQSNVLFVCLLQSELSHCLQLLSEKAKAATEGIAQLKHLCEKVSVSGIVDLLVTFWLHFLLL